MKMFKKVLSLVLAGAMVLSLAACGSKDSGSSDGGDSGEEVFKIGSIGPATGAAAIYGLGVKNGAQVAVNEINEAGGINGYKVEFKFEDDELNNEKSVNE